MIFELIVLLILVLLGFIIFVKKPSTINAPAPTPSTTVQHEQTVPETRKVTEDIQTHKQISESIPSQFERKEEKESIKEAPEIIKEASIQEEVQPLLEERPLDLNKEEVSPAPEFTETNVIQEDSNLLPQAIDKEIVQKEEIPKIPLEVEERSPLQEKVQNPFENFTEEEVQPTYSTTQERYENEELKPTPSDIPASEVVQEEDKPMLETLEEQVLHKEEREILDQPLETQEELSIQKEEVNPFSEGMREVDTRRDIAVADYHLVADNLEQQNMKDIPEAFVDQIREEEVIKPESEALPEETVQKEVRELSNPFFEPPTITEEVTIQAEVKHFLGTDKVDLKEEIQPALTVHDEKVDQEVLRPIPEVTESPMKQKEIETRPEFLIEERTPIQREEVESPAIFERNTPLESYEEKGFEPQENEVTEPNDMDKTIKGRDLNKQAGAKVTMKKGFNFRANRSKVESILKKESSMNKGSFQLDSSTDNDNTVLSALESTMDKSGNQSLQEKSDEKVLTVREDNILKTEEEPQTKKRGFNFKNPKRKPISTDQNEKSVVSTSQELQQTENIDPTLQGSQTLNPGLGDSGKVEVKKLKGFNFRNSGRVKAE